MLFISIDFVTASRKSTQYYHYTANLIFIKQHRLESGSLENYLNSIDRQSTLEFRGGLYPEVLTRHQRVSSRERIFQLESFYTAIFILLQCYTNRTDRSTANSPLHTARHQIFISHLSPATMRNSIASVSRDLNESFTSRKSHQFFLFSGFRRKLPMSEEKHKFTIHPIWLHTKINARFKRPSKTEAQASEKCLCQLPKGL